MNATTHLTEMRRTASRLFRGDTTNPNDAARLAELVMGLDNWLCAHGAPPSDWLPDDAPMTHWAVRAHALLTTPVREIPSPEQWRARCAALLSEYPRE